MWGVRGAGVGPYLSVGELIDGLLVFGVEILEDGLGVVAREGLAHVAHRLARERDELGVAHGRDEEGVAGDLRRRVDWSRCESIRDSVQDLR